MWFSYKTSAQWDIEEAECNVPSVLLKLRYCEFIEIVLDVFLRFEFSPQFNQFEVVLTVTSVKGWSHASTINWFWAILFVFMDYNKNFPPHACIHVRQCFDEPFFVVVVNVSYHFSYDSGAFMHVGLRTIMYCSILLCWSNVSLQLIISVTFFICQHEAECNLQFNSPILSLFLICSRYRCSSSPLSAPPKS